LSSGAGCLVSLSLLRGWPLALCGGGGREPRFLCRSPHALHCGLTPFARKRVRYLPRAAHHSFSWWDGVLCPGVGELALCCESVRFWSRPAVRCVACFLLVRATEYPMQSSEPVRPCTTPRSFFFQDAASFSSAHRPAVHLPALNPPLLPLFVPPPPHCRHLRYASQFVWKRLCCGEVIYLYALPTRDLRTGAVDEIAATCGFRVCTNGRMDGRCVSTASVIKDKRW
jgi:hypothetical protein